MSDRPPADELLAIARDMVLQELLPALPAHAHYEARMVANAMAIARREHLAGDVDAEIRAFVAAPEGLADASGRAWAEVLVAAIRAGAFDVDRHLEARLVEVLVHWTGARLAISNPRLLQSPEA